MAISPTACGAVSVSDEVAFRCSIVNGLAGKHYVRQIGARSVGSAKSGVMSLLSERSLQRYLSWSFDIIDNALASDEA